LRNVEYLIVTWTLNIDELNKFFYYFLLMKNPCKLSLYERISGKKWQKNERCRHLSQFWNETNWL